MRYLVRHPQQGREIISAPVEAQQAVETAIALAGAGREVVVTDERGRSVDLEALAERVRRDAER